MAIKKRPVSPRQKMINLMYVVLMAMLALNVSTEVLNGFSIVEDSLNRTTANSSKENQVVYDDFEAQMKANPAKVKVWFDKAREVKRMSDSLYNFADELKAAIVAEADGKNFDVRNIRNKENLEAANQVMLAPGRGRGAELYKAVNSFRNRIVKMITDPARRAAINDNLATVIPKNATAMGKNWQEYMFEDMPVAAAVTLLSKLQSDIRYAEGEVLHTLVANIDMKDIRVNSLNAFVIPNSQTIVRGDKFSARIVMAAVDTTQVPDIYIGNRKVDLSGGLYETVCSRTGDFTLAGYMEVISELNLTDYVSYNVTDDELKAYGLDKPDLDVSFKYRVSDDEGGEEQEGTAVLHISRGPKEKEEDTDQEEEITAYARIGESKIIYKISGLDYEDLMEASCSDLRHQEVIWADFDDIIKAEITLEDKEDELTVKEEGKENVWYYQEKEINTDELRDALNSLSVSEFTEKVPAGKEEISLTLQIDNENQPEVRIELYRYDGNNCLAVVDGNPLSLVNRSYAVDLIEAVNAIVLN